MECKNHQGIEADYTCSSCGHALCTQCTVEVGNRSYCKTCLERIMYEKGISQKAVNVRRKSKFLTFCLSFIPGGGHMYLGLINKGLSLMGIFFGTLFFVLFLGEALRIHWFEGFLIPTISVLSVFYSLFDSLAAADQIISGEKVPDISLFGSDFKFSILKEKLTYRKNIIGCILIFLGCVSLFNLFVDAIIDVLWQYFKFRLPFSISSMVFPLLLIILGVYLLKKGRTIDM